MEKEEEQARQMLACVMGLIGKRVILQRASLGNWKESQYGWNKVVGGGKPLKHTSLFAI